MAETDAPGDMDARVLKAVDEAKTGLARLMQEMKPTAIDIRRGDISEDTCVKFQKRVKAAMARYGAATRLKEADGLGPAAQAAADWLAGLLTSCLALQKRVDTGRKQSKLDVKRKWRAHVKAAKDAVRATPNVPMPISKLVKAAEKAGDDHADAEEIPYVPMALALMQMVEVIETGMKARP